MVDHDPDSTIGVYCGPDAGMIEEFDEFFETRPGKYSRSAEIKKAMRLYLAVRRFLDEEGLEVPAGPSQGMFVRRAFKKHLDDLDDR